MWVMTKSDWPVLINLSRTAHIGYQQIAKFDPRTRIVASAWEQEYTLAECADGDQAKALISLISQALAERGKPPRSAWNRSGIAGGEPRRGTAVERADKRLDRNETASAVIAFKSVEGICIPGVHQAG